MKYTLFDKNSNEPIAHYDSDLNGDKIPAEAIQVTNDQWLDMINNQGQRKLDRATGNIVAFTPDYLKIGAIKKSAQAHVDLLAENARLQFITPGAGQSLVYELKRLEATSYLDAVSSGATPVDSDYPLMNARASRLSMAMADVATEWSNKSAAWLAVATSIEDLREGAKELIDAVADSPTAKDEIDSIVGSINWPVPV